MRVGGIGGGGHNDPYPQEKTAFKKTSLIRFKDKK